uniref:Uncharacterized protein n=1 Tax=Brassica campestris TaxID=3711 RepID=A0A3P6ANM1_BRACM|nr:unnamed protein product [Brassica rapa]
MKKDKWCCYVSCSRWTKELQRTGSAFTCVTCNNANVVGVLRYLDVIIWKHKVLSSWRERILCCMGYIIIKLLISAKVDVGGSTLEGAPTT